MLEIFQKVLQFQKLSCNYFHRTCSPSAVDENKDILKNVPCRLSCSRLIL